MQKKKVGALTIKSFALLVVLGTAYYVMAEDAATPYPKMAPIEQYLMDRTAEIALARSGAPESISRDSEVLVLGRHGFETAMKGKNGFCASWNVPGLRQSITRTFGILSYVARSALMRRPHVPTFSEQSRRRT